MHESDAGAFQASETPSAPLSVWPEPMWHNLFYDLAFVAATLVLAGSYSVDYTLLNGIWIALTFTMLWCTWLVTSLAVARMPVGPVRVVLVAIQMGFVLAAAVAAGGAVAQAADLLEVIFGGMLLSVAALVLVAVPKQGPQRPRLSAGQLIAAGVVLGASPLLPHWAYLLAWFTAAILVGIVAYRFVRGGSDTAHTFTHRFGELTMVVLGESFVKVGLADDAQGLSQFRITALVLIVVIITTTWWGYFGVLGRRDVGPRRVAWAAMHIPLHVALVFLAVGLAKLLTASPSLLNGGVGSLLIAHLVLVLLAFAGLSLVNGGPGAKLTALSLTLAAGVTAGLALLTPYATWLTPTIATVSATIPFVLTIAALHYHQAKAARRLAQRS